MFGRNKAIPKSQLPDKQPFTLYHPNNGRPESDRVWTQNYYQVVSIDPSIKNFGFRVERRHIVHHSGSISSGPIVPLSFQRIAFGPPPVKKKRNAEGKLVPIEPEPDPNGPVTLYSEVTDYLDQHMDAFLETHFFIIERQLPHNYRAVRIAQHVISYLLDRLKSAPLMPIILEIDSKLKSRQLGCPRGLNERQNKLWLISKALDLCRTRGDTASFNLITREKKKDDLADTICQIEATFILLHLPATVAITPRPSLQVVGANNMPNLPPINAPPNPPPPRGNTASHNGLALQEFLQQQVPSGGIKPLKLHIVSP